MKYLIILFFGLITFKFIADAQTKKAKPFIKPNVSKALSELKKSVDTSAALTVENKKLAIQKIVYRTKVVEVHDTVWRIDTCIKVITKIDSAAIALMFKQPDSIKETKSSRKVFFFFNKKKKSK